MSFQDIPFNNYHHNDYHRYILRYYCNDNNVFG